jgi:hypothetical protein
VSRSRERTRFLTSYRSCAVRTADYRAGRLSACFTVPVAREQDGIFTLRGRVAWAHDFNPDRNIGATFQTLPGVSFVVNGAAQASDSALVHRLRREEMAERLVGSGDL